MRKLRNMGREEKVLNLVATVLCYELSAFIVAFFLLLHVVGAGIFMFILLGITASTYYFLERGKLRFVKIMLLVVPFMQITLTTLFVFGTESGYSIYYMILIPLAFLFYDFKLLANKIAIAITIIVIGMVFTYTLVAPTNESILLKTFSPLVYQWVHGASAFIVFTAIACFTWMFATDLEKQRNELNLLASTDGLTKVLNRRSFFEKSEKVFNQVIKNDGMITLIIFDVDYFKKVNDTYGHPIGDEVLKKIAKGVKGIIRKEDIFARYGGEEFAITFEGITKENGYKIAEKIRLWVEEQVFDGDKTKTFKVTVSVGVAQNYKEIVDFDELVQIADVNLYYAKENGRNQVVY